MLDNHDAMRYRIHTDINALRQIINAGNSLLEFNIEVNKMAEQTRECVENGQENGANFLLLLVISL